MLSEHIRHLGSMKSSILAVVSIDNHNCDEPYIPRCGLYEKWNERSF